MIRREQEILERLGPRGLSRALRDILDHPRLVKLANACGLTYPGMRTRTQKRGTLVQDLSERATKEAATRRAVVRTLRKESAASAKEWAALDSEARAGRIADPDYLRRPGVLGRLLFVVADDGKVPEQDDHLSRLRRLAEEAGTPTEASGPTARSSRGGSERDGKAATDGDRANARIAKQAAELRKKVQYLDGQLRKSRDAEKALKRDLMERRGELAEARMRIERLRQEVTELERGAEDREAPDRPDEIDRKIERTLRAVRKLSTEQRHLAKEIRQLGEAASHDPPASETKAETADAIDALRKETASLRRARKKDRDLIGARLEELAATIRKIGSTVEPVDRDPRRRRATGANARVGVFVDVQNVYYGARQLKGKLDFDALLQAAAGERRLILAQAYVVESKEIDQSGFIARLEQRAIQVRRKTLQVRADGSMKGDWDMEMALDILDAAPALDVVVLVSGDGDFTSLVTRVKALGPRVEVMGFPRNTANSLLEAADRFVPLDRKFMIRTERKTKG